MIIKEKIGEKVLNKRGEVGLITNVDDKVIYVHFDTRDTRFELNAFNQGFLKFENETLQSEIDEEINDEKSKLEEIEEKKKTELETQKQMVANYNDPEKTILDFKGEYRFLSNFYPCQFEFEGIKYPSSEAAFQAQKCSNNADKLKYSAATNPVLAKRMGRKEKINVSEWNEKSPEIMKRILRVKFSIPELKEKLLSTGDKILIEGNSHHDNIWGKCLCNSCKNKHAQNKLGVILMEIREELRDNN